MDCLLKSLTSRPSSNLTLKYFLFLLFAASFFSVQAQEIFYSISGKSLDGKTGDRRHDYDYWIRPNSTTGKVAARLEIYDAGVSSGGADVVFSGVDTKTTYTLYPLGARYNRTSDQLTSKPFVQDTALQTLIAGNEPIYRNRWTKFIDLPAPNTASPDGYILRVSTDGGDDANAFKLRVLEQRGSTSKDWAIYSLDLSVALVKFPAGYEIQFQSLHNAEVPPDGLTASGEESAVLQLKDDFNRAAPLSSATTFWSDSVGNASGNGVKNHWGLSVTRDVVLNHFAVYGKSPVLWAMSAIAVPMPKPPRARIIESPTEDCFTQQFVLSTVALRSTPYWAWRGEVQHSNSATFNFGASGDYTIEAWLPTEGLYFPKYWTQTYTTHINSPPSAVITAKSLPAKSINGVPVNFKTADGEKRLTLSTNERLVLSGDASSDAEGATLRYEWSLNDVRRSSKSAFVFTSPVPGNYTVTLRVSDNARNSRCTQNRDTVYLRVNNPPTVDVAWEKEFAEGEAMVFSAKNVRDADNDSLRLTWSGTGITSNRNADSVRVLHQRRGVYEATLTVDDGMGVANSTYSKTVRYRVNAPPEPRFAIPTLAAPGNKIRLFAGASSDPDDWRLRYTWDISDGRSFERRDQTITFDSPGDYDVTLMVDDGHGTSNSIQDLSRSIHINAPPEPRITGLEASSVSARQLISARTTTDADGDALSYRWDFGDGKTATGDTVTHTYQKSGVYTVRLVVDDGLRQSNSVQRTASTIRLRRFPIALFTAPNRVDPNVPFNADASRSRAYESDLVSYEWYIDGKKSADGKTAALQITEPGDHTIELHVKDNSGFDDSRSVATKIVHAHVPPKINLRASHDVAAPNEEIQFDVSPIIDAPVSELAANSKTPARTKPNTRRRKAILWTFDDGKTRTTASGESVRRRFAASGNVAYSVSVDDGYGFRESRQTVTGTVRINSRPTIVTETKLQSNSQRVLLDASKSYDADKDGLRYEWRLPDGTTRNEAAFVWESKTSGVQFVSLTVDDGQNLANSKKSETIKVVINHAPVAVIDSMIFSCTGKLVLFNGSKSYDPDGDAVKRTWDFGDGSQSTETDPAHTFQRPGNYLVTLTLDDGFAPPVVAKLPVVVGGSPVAVQSFKDTTVCVQAAIAFDAGQSFNPVGSIASYSWDFGDGETAVGEKVQHNYSKAGAYSVTLTVTGSESPNKQNTCSSVSQSSSLVRVVEGVTADFAIEPWVAESDVILLDDASSKTRNTITLATWRIQKDTAGKGDDEVTLTGRRVSHRFSKAGFYPVTLTVQTDAKTACNGSMITKFVKVNAPPVLSAVVPTSAAVYEPVVLDASASYDPDGVITKYQWMSDGKVIGNTPRLSHIFRRSGLNLVTISITDDSPTRTRATSQTFNVDVNPTATPALVVPRPVFENEVVSLASVFRQRVSTVSPMFVVDGVAYAADTVRFSAGKHWAAVIINDGKNLPNSQDSIRTEFDVMPVPELSAAFPKKMLRGSRLNARDFFKNETIGFAMQPEFVAARDGESIIPVTWSPRRVVLSTNDVPVKVYPPLEFTDVFRPSRIVWNPANPTYIASALRVNRSDTDRVIYRWLQNGKVIGFGASVEVRLKRGNNEFILEARDEDVFGSTPVQITFRVIAE
jgi:PKD repeat protein